MKEPNPEFDFVQCIELKGLNFMRWQSRFYPRLAFPQRQHCVPRLMILTFEMFSNSKNLSSMLLQRERNEFFECLGVVNLQIC